MPELKPSIPSINLITLVHPSIKNSVIGYAKIPNSIVVPSTVISVRSILP